MDAADCLECRPWPPALSAARYAFVLEPPADDLVHALKYEGWPELAAVMGAAMARLAFPERAAARSHVVVPVPTTAERLEARGYNQAELLAGCLAREIGASTCGAITRKGGRPSQTSLAPDERRENVRGVFGPAPGRARAVAGAHVMLVDDVLTTGATASEAATVLTDAGAATVTLVAFARALPTRSRKRA